MLKYAAGFGSIHSMRLFSAALFFVCCLVRAFDPATQDDSLALVRHFKKPTEPLKPFVDGAIAPNVGETITLMGGTDVYQMHETCEFEISLHFWFPDKNLRFRNVSWPADTVYRQQRPMFFYTVKGDNREGSVPDQREKLEPGIFVLRFGRMESLDGLDRLDEFEKAYGRLLDALMEISPRISLLRPVPFSKEGPAGTFADERNSVLAKYTESIQKLADSRGILLSIDMSGFREAIRGVSVDSNLHARIREKNKLWLQYYRPTNWAFLFGDRQHVPSSRDHKNTEHRWFVEELEKIPPLIEKADEAIWKEVQR